MQSDEILDERTEVRLCGSSSRSLKIISTCTNRYISHNHHQGVTNLGVCASMSREVFRPVVALLNDG